jgi:hypothetical protein
MREELGDEMSERYKCMIFNCRTISHDEFIANNNIIDEIILQHNDKFFSLL